MMVRYRLDPASSRFTVQAFATGLFSFLGHSPTFAVRDFGGEMCFDSGTFAGATLQVSVQAASLTVVDAVRPADREEIEARMRRDVLDTGAYPEIRFQAVELAATPITQGQYRLHIQGQLALHGVSRLHALEAQMLVYEDGVRLTGTSSLRLSDYRIKPIIALGGTIKLQDQLKLTFDLVGWQEGQSQEKT